MAKHTEMLYANADGTRLVEENDPEARYQINPDDPGEFAELVRGGGKAQRQAEDKAEKAGKEK